MSPASRSSRKVCPIDLQLSGTHSALVGDLRVSLSLFVREMGDRRKRRNPWSLGKYCYTCIVP